MKKYKVIIFASTFLVLSGNAFSGMYFGASLGQSSSSDVESASDYYYFLYTNVETESSETKDSAFSIFTGYDFELLENQFAIELGWTDLGENTLEALGQDLPIGGDGKRTLDVRTEAEAINISFIGKKNVVKDLSLFGKLGVSSWDVSGRLDGVVYNSSGDQIGSTFLSGSDSGTDVFFGFGLEYKFILFQLERYKIGDSNTSYISIGAKI